ncbi:hypothetical protein OG555_33845 [Kribbella sp. NBC_01484]|uniref:WD40/YVTN/BNR-like repeat-containing protein n=1 Tax=Kribbella sp. NBC_01484 TaxID=2903579 RepID=UPI002E33EFEB|nr:hypothetical protein [Kribbella sp. NBC_01484]
MGARRDVHREEARARHNWVPVGPRNVAGRMRAIVCGDPANPDPQVWFAASAGGGVWRTRDAGRHWEPLPDWHDRRCLVVGAMAVAPTDPTRIYAATGEASPAGSNTLRGFGVFVSTNGGDTWDNFGAGPRTRMPKPLRFYPPPPPEPRRSASPRRPEAGCEPVGVPAKADVPNIDLRVAASPEGGGRRHPVLGGAHLAELVATPAAVAAPDRPALFAVRAALGKDVLKAGVPNTLYLRVRNVGTVDSTHTRLRLFRLDLAATPITANEIVAAAPPVPAGSTHIEELAWNPGPVAPSTELLLCVADDNRPGWLLDVPADFADLETLRAFAGRRPGVALRVFDVIP